MGGTGAAGRMAFSHRQTHPAACPGASQVRLNFEGSRSAVRRTMTRAIAVAGAEAPARVHGRPRREDAEQGALGDGWLIAVLGAVAGHLPGEITSRIADRPDGSYLVSLAETRCTASGAVPTGRTIELTVTPDLPVYDHSPGEPAYAKADRAAWPAIAEKAFAGAEASWPARRRSQWAQSWERICATDAADPDVVRPRYGPAPAGYVRLGHSGTAFDQAEALTQFTGRQAVVRYLPVRRGPMRRTLRRQLAARRPVIISIRAQAVPGEVLPHRLVAGQAYEITRVRWRTAVLRNPWGYHHPGPVPLARLADLTIPGYATLT